MSAINAEFLTAIRNRATNAIPGHVNLVLDYLKDTYGKVTPQLLDKKETLLRAMNYTLASPIDTIFTAVEDLVDCAKLNGATMTQQHNIEKAYIILNKGGILKEGIKTWNRLQAAHKTWIAFKIHFRRAHNGYRETTDTTLEEAAIEQHDAHLVQLVIKGVQAITEEPNVANTEIANEVANIASQVSQSQELIPQLINQMHQMQAMMNHIQCQLTNNNVPISPPIYAPTTYTPPPPPPSYQPPPANQQYQQQYQRQQPGWMRGGRGRGRGSGTGRGQGRGGRCFDHPMTYCWTHGNCYHNSGTCSNTSHAHQQAAAFQNRLGGNDRNCT